MNYFFNNLKISTKKKDTCQGDSGGPLFVVQKIGNWKKFVLAGITSYGDKCASYNKAAYLFNIN